MSDTVLVALITFLSGAVGAVAGVVGAYISSRNTARVQMQQAVLDEYFRARLKAYEEVHVAMEIWAQAPKDEDKAAAIYRALNFARIVASEETAKAIVQMGNCVAMIKVEGKRPDNYSIAMSTMFHEMQKDLTSFQMPVIEEKRSMLRREKEQDQTGGRG